LRARAEQGPGSAVARTASGGARQPLAGRRLWFVGIGGAGLSGYAALARAWGAEVGGWDAVETPYLDGVAGARVEIAPDPVVPEGWEIVVSTAYAERAKGRSRADFLAELVSLQDAIVVAGTHGKGTTAAMIAFCLDRLGLDPAFLIGAPVPQLEGNARAGAGWLVVEGDESDRTVAALRPRIAVVTNVDLDHHATFASLAELRAFFDAWLAAAPLAVRGEQLEPATVDLALPGEHNRHNAATALAALELAGVQPSDAIPVLREFRGTGRRFEERGRVGGVTVVDDYAHHPTEVSAVIEAARELSPQRVLVLYQPHLPSRTRHVARELGAALAAADAVVVTDVYPAREEPLPGVTGKLVVDAVAEIRPGMRVAWAPTVDDGAGLIAAWALPGDLVLTAGAGDVDRAVPTLLEALR
jgi:UDP-N-acetylmuramate--alanine ligase